VSAGRLKWIPCRLRRLARAWAAQAAALSDHWLSRRRRLPIWNFAS